MLNICYALIYFVSAAIVLFIAYFLIKKDVYRSNVFFILMFVTATSGLIFGGMNYLVKNEGIRLLCHELKQIFFVFSPPFYFLYIYKFFNGSTKKFKVLAWVILTIAVSLFILILSNPYHHLFKANLSIEYRADYSLVTTTPGVMYYPISLYQLFLYIIVIIITGESLRKFGKMNLKSLSLIFLMGTPFLVYVIYQLFSGLSSFDYSTPLTPLTLAISTYFLEKTTLKSIVPIVKESIINRIPAPLFALNSENIVIFANCAAKKIFSIEVARSIHEFLDQVNQHRLFHDKKIYFKEKHYNVDYSVVKTDSEDILSHIFILTDITQLQTMTKDLKETTSTDPLTRLYNRRYLFNQFDTNRIKDNITVTLLDVKNFRTLNLEQGYFEGDSLLLKIANILRNNIDNHYLGQTFRYDGDVFLFIISDISENFLINIIDQIQTDLKILPRKISFGYAIENKKDFKDLDSLINIADKKLQENKTRL